MGFKEGISLSLYKINAVKFGKFKLKDGSISPIYIDLRQLVSYPAILRQVAKAYAELIKDLKFDRICGIPYAALPIATAISLELDVPMIYPRKEAKDYGTRKKIEGQFKIGEKILVIDDLITSGASKLEAIAPLKEAGLNVKDVAVLIDREQSGQKELWEKGYSLHSVLKITDLLNVLRQNTKITEEQYKQTIAYLKKS